MHGYLSINTKNPPTVDFGNIVVNAYIDVRHLDVTRLNTFKSPSIHQLERLGFAQPGRPPIRPCTIKYMETLTWVQLVGKLGNKSGAQPWVCRTAHGMRCRPAVPPWRVTATKIEAVNYGKRGVGPSGRACQSWTWVEAAAWASQIPRHTICMGIAHERRVRFEVYFWYGKVLI